MKKAISLLKSSTVQIYRDQMLLVLCLAPFLAGAGIRILMPLADYWLVRLISFSIRDYYLLADTMTLLLGSMTIGAMTGLLMLDERDEGVIAYFAVTPFGGTAYLFSRLAVPCLYSFVSTLLTMIFSNLSGIGYSLLILPIGVSSLGGILISMLMVAIASNKVEGLAISKLLGLIFLGMPAAWFGSSVVQLAGALLPTYWISKMLLDGAAARLPAYWGDAAAGLVCTLIWIAVLLQLFKRRIS